MLMSRGSLGIFWSNWLVGSITTLALLLLAWPLIAWLLRGGRALAQRRPTE
jgi:putative tricarboxylic transport membrane protein